MVSKNHLTSYHFSSAILSSESVRTNSTPKSPSLFVVLLSKNTSHQISTGVADWTETIEESILAEYQLPVLDRADVHLFGDRKYFGNVIELYYKGELMDQYATPGRLHGIHAQEQFKHQIQPDFLPYDLLDEDYDGTELLLPEIDN